MKILKIKKPRLSARMNINKAGLLPVLFYMLLIASGVLLNSCNTSNEQYSGEYLTGDFHQHTTYSGGEYSIGHVMEASDKYGLDWWSNSDHGGTREFWGKASGNDFGTRVTWTCAGIKPLGSP